MTRKHFVIMWTVLVILLLSVSMTAAQGPQLVSNGICPPGNTYSSGCDVATPLGKIDVVDVQRIAGRWHTTGTYTEPYWSLTGNAGTDPAANFLGTTDNQPLVFKTNGNEAMRIDEGGNVGIGTEDPGAKLDISDESDNTQLRLTRTDDSLYTDFSVDPSGNLEIDPSGGVVFMVDGEIHMWKEGNLRTKLSSGFDSYITGGNVGIGTTEPQAQLHVSESWLLGAPDAFPDFGVSGWLTSRDGNLYEAGGGNWAHFFSAYGGGDIVGFGTSGGVGQLPDTKVIVKNNGNVGIGTTSPQSTLHVQGDYIQFPTISGGPPPNADCDEAAEAGRMVVRTDGSTNLYVCTGVTGWVGK